jgi:pimeloyl-ACP methyl ester carboxylesterase
VTYVEVDNGVRLHVQDLGAGPAVVLVSGFGLDHRLWDRQVRVLTGLGHRVVCVSQRGHGRSDKPLHGYDIDRLATDLATALERLGVRDAAVVGHSFGGQVAFHASAVAPQVVSKLVLVGSNAVRASRSDGFPFGAPPEAILDALVADEHEDRIAARYKTILSGFGGEPDQRLVDWLVRCSLRMPSWSAIACYRSMLTADLLAEIPCVTQPVLQIIGSTDPVHSAKGARWLQRQLTNATLLEIADCGHYPMLEAADAFDAALSKFLTSE